MNEKLIIKIIEDFARKTMEGFDSGHDWWHLNRVRNMAIQLHKDENEGDRFVIEISALLHDIDDKKFRTASGPGAKAVITELLHKLGIKDNIIHEVVLINENISFSSGSRASKRSPEFLIVQDADRLDAIGAIGIARAFNYGGFRNNPIYIPESDEYEKIPSTIGHFYDKLLLLKGMMNTSTGRKIAEERHIFLEQFLEQFYSEWNLSSSGSK